MGVLDLIANAQVNARTANLEAGIGLGKTIGVETVDTRKGPMIVVQFEMEKFHAFDAANQHLNEKGTKPAAKWPLYGDAADPAARNAKAWALAMLRFRARDKGLSPDTVPDTVFDTPKGKQILSALLGMATRNGEAVPSPVVGYRVAWRATARTTQNGKEITDVEWMHESDLPEFPSRQQELPLDSGDAGKGKGKGKGKVNPSDDSDYWGAGPSDPVDDEDDIRW